MSAKAVATAPRSGSSQHHRCSSPAGRRSRSRSRERRHRPHPSRRSLSSSSSAASSTRGSHQRSVDRRTGRQNRHHSGDSKGKSAKAKKKQKHKKERKEKKKKKKEKERDWVEKVSVAERDSKDSRVTKLTSPAKELELLPSENCQQVKAEIPEPSATTEKTQQMEVESKPEPVVDATTTDCQMQPEPSGLAGLCQVLRVSEATRRRIAEGGGATGCSREDASAGGASVGIGTFGRPKGAEDPVPTSATTTGVGKPTEPKRQRAPKDGKHCDRERRQPQRRGRGSSDRRRRGREKRSRRRSRSGSGRSRDSSKSSNDGNVDFSRGGDRLNIDKDRLRRRAIENTVIGLSERCPKKLADMPCFKALGVRASELEKICRKLVSSEQAAASQQSLQPPSQPPCAGSGTVKDRDRPAAGGSCSGAGHSASAGSVSLTRHPFQLRPEGSSGVSRFAPVAAAASQKKELLAAFPVSSGTFHLQQDATVTAAPASSDHVESALRQPPVVAAGCNGFHGDWETAKAAAPPPPPPTQRSKSPQAWMNKQQFLNAQPITDGIGHRLLQKMGWRWGQGLGRRNEGPTEPLAIGYKTDRKGLASQEDRPAAAMKQFPGHGGKKKTKSAGATTAAASGAPQHQLQQGKHPISMLMETTKRLRLPDPQFRLVHESGPPHDRIFVFCARVGATEFQPTRPSKNKKEAKAAAAAVALQQLGFVPRT